MKIWNYLAFYSLLVQAQESEIYSFVVLIVVHSSHFEPQEENASIHLTLSLREVLFDH